MSQRSTPSPAARDVIVYRVQSPALQVRCIDAITWLARPGLEAGRLHRHGSHFVLITSADATAGVLAEGFVLGIDPSATRVDPVG